MASSAPAFSKAIGPQARELTGKPATHAVSPPPLLAILEPVDLSVDQGLPQAAQILRSAAGRAGRFQVLSGLEIARKLLDFDWNGGRPCHEFQCAFDAGNILLADYVLYGTVTPLEGLHACTFNILDTRSGKVVQSRVDQAPMGPDAAADGLLHGRLAGFAAGLEPGAFRQPVRSSRGVIAVVDLDEVSTESRVLIERLGTRIQSLPEHDLMSQVELRELLSAMEISVAPSAATDSGLIRMGGRLNVDYLVKSETGRLEGGRRLDLALYDIAGKRRVRAWSAPSTGDYAQVLETESRIFRTLEELTASGKVETPRAGFPWGRGILTAAGLAAAGGIGTWAYSLHEAANQAHRKAEASMSPKDSRMWKRRTEERDRGTVLLGSLAALTFGATITLWTF